MFQPNYNEVISTMTTPAYVFDTDVLCERIEYIKKMLGSRVQVCYAMKANPFIIKSMEKCIDHYEVCSHGEFEICERSGIPMDKVVLSGVYKAPHDIDRVIKQYKNTIVYTSESVHQFHLMNAVANEIKCQIKVLPRVTTGNQFGMSEAELCELVKNRQDYPYMDIIGIHHFSGTQRKKAKLYKEELDYVDNLITKLEEDYGYVAKLLEFGPGFYVEYFQDGKPHSEEDMLNDFVGLLNEMRFKGDITLELGRFIAASCGNYYTDIVDYKNNGIPYCIVNGGLHQMTYYGQMMAMKHPFYRQLKEKETSEEPIPCNVSGSLCTINDNLVKGLPLQTPQIGDIIEFQRVGAYAMCEGISLFLSRDLPSVYLYSQKDGLSLQRGRFETNILNYKQ